MSRSNHKIFLTSILSFVFFFSFFQPSQAGFFDWFRKNNSQSSQSIAAVASSAKQYILSVSKSGSGVVISDDGKINCGKQCKASYPANSKIVLKAEAGNNYKFDRWNGCDKVSDGKCQTTLNKSKMIVAKFTSKRANSSSSQKSSSLSARKASSSKSSSSKSSNASSKSSSSKAFSSSRASKSSSSVSNSSSSSSSSENTQNTQDTLGAQRTLVILVNSSYLDSRNWQLISSKDAYDVVFNKTDAFIRENSYGKTFLTGKVIGPYFIDTNDSEIDQNKIFALADNDADFTKYDRIIVFSSVSGRSSLGKQKYITPDGTAYFSIMYEGHYADYALAHEFGHSLGMYHTGFLMCDVRHAKANDCQTMITGGPFDPEGTGIGTGHYTAAHKDLIGWFSFQQAIVAKSSGLYSLEPLETNSNGPKTIKVSLGDNLYYYLEYRQPIGLDSSAKTEIPTDIEKHMYDGVLLYFAPKHISGFGGGDDAHLFNPRGQIKVNEPEVNHTLKVGETFIDSNGIKISVVKADAEGAQVSVYYPSYN